MYRRILAFALVLVLLSGCSLQEHFASSTEPNPLLIPPPPWKRNSLKLPTLLHHLRLRWPQKKRQRQSKRL